VSGDGRPLGELVARDRPATFFGPRGDAVSGAAAVAERYEKDAGSFEPGGENRIEVLQTASSGDVGYWVGYQRARAKMRGTAERQQFDLRVTEIFRRENGAWVLVHRHADVAR
jgi:ketosteroid isomerase-like protein